jgi:ligand-binding sensor domain-containing protein
VILAALTVVTAVTDVQSCLPLADGRVLAGTQGGLVVVGPDGAPQRVATSLDGLPGTRIGALAEAGDGAIWVGGETGVARVRLDPAFTVEKTVPSRSPVRALLVHDGSLYVGTYGDGALRLSGDGSEGGPLGPWRQQVTSLAALGGVVYVGHVGGLSRGDTGAAVPGVPEHPVFALAVHDGKLEIGTLDGLMVLEDGAAHTVGPPLDTRALLDGPKLLVGTYGEGLLDEPSLDARHVNGLGRAYGVTCVAARDGLYVGAEGAWRKARLGGLPSNDVTALATLEGRLWVGTFDAGLAVADGTGGWRVVPGLDPRVNALAADPRRAGVWVATARGLALVGADGRVARRWTAADGLPAADCHTLALLGDGTLAVGTARGLALISDDRITVVDEKQGLPANAIWAIAEAPDGLWIGTSRGLVSFRQGRRVRRYSMATGHLDEDWVTALAPDGEDLWVGTYGKGVTRLHREGKDRFTPTHLGGGPVNVAGLLREGRMLYAATMAGLKQRAVDGSEWTPVADAAPGLDTTAIIRNGPELWVASRRGLAMHH